MRKFTELKKEVLHYGSFNQEPQTEHEVKKSMWAYFSELQIDLRFDMEVEDDVAQYEFLKNYFTEEIIRMMKEDPRELTFMEYLQAIHETFGIIEVDKS